VEKPGRPPITHARKPNTTRKINYIGPAIPAVHPGSASSDAVRSAGLNRLFGLRQLEEGVPSWGIARSADW
jgi:hypothetical protein